MAAWAGDTIQRDGLDGAQGRDLDTGRDCLRGKASRRNVACAVSRWRHEPQGGNLPFLLQPLEARVLEMGGIMCLPDLLCAPAHLRKCQWSR